jgi:hypothetical protein
MYKIEYTLKETFFGGSMLRGRRNGTQELSTLKGISRFIEDNKPFINIVIYDALKKDITREFIEDLDKC